MSAVRSALITALDGRLDDSGMWIDGNGDYIDALNQPPDMAEHRLAKCEDAMKQARWAIALQLRRWRDGDEICAVSELQNAHDALADLVGESKPEEKGNSI